MLKKALSKEKELTSAIDSNLHGYLVDAILPKYDPASEECNFASELIAVFRCFIYAGQSFYITPTVEKEYLKIPDNKIKCGTEIKLAHKRLHDLMLLDLCPAPDPADVDRLKQDYLPYHNKENDCKILTEAEIGKINVLLTNDDTFYKRIHKRTKSIKLMKATEFWDSLKIPKGSRSKNKPREDNPLYNKDWWRW